MEVGKRSTTRRLEKDQQPWRFEKGSTTIEVRNIPTMQGWETN